MTAEQLLTPRRILRFWLPLAATWLMMAAEGPFLAAIIARMKAPTFNLAAFGVALSFAMLIEAPVIMVMSASTALVRGANSFVRLRGFVYSLDATISGVMVILVLPPVFRFVAQGLIGLPPEVARLAHVGTLILLPWPAAIGYRRFYQGILIRHHLTRRVAYGTVVRLATMAVTGSLLYATTRLPGVWVGAAALAAGVVMEAAASRVMAAAVVRHLRRSGPSGEGGETLTARGLVSFYLPLALTSLLTLGVQPLLTLFLGHSRMAIESLAVLPVVNSLVFIVRSPAIALQEVGIALLGDQAADRALRRFAAVLATVLTGALGVIGFTPLAGAWFHGVSGLAPQLSRLATLPVRILLAMPALEVLLSFQRAWLVNARATRAITAATAIEAAGIVACLAVAIGAADLVGIVAMGLALLSGRLLAVLFLARAVRRSHRPLPPATRVLEATERG